MHVRCTGKSAAPQYAYTNKIKRNINRNEKLRILSQAIVWIHFFFLLLYDFIWVEWIFCFKPYAIWLIPCTINHLAMNHMQNAWVHQQQSPSTVSFYFGCLPFVFRHFYISLTAETRNYNMKNRIELNKLISSTFSSVLNVHDDIPFEIKSRRTRIFSGFFSSFFFAAKNFNVKWNTSQFCKNKREMKSNRKERNLQ